MLVTGCVARAVRPLTAIINLLFWIYISNYFYGLSAIDPEFVSRASNTLPQLNAIESRQILFTLKYEMNMFYLN
jgi:hypothetical protein